MKLTAEQSEECRRLFRDEGWSLEQLASHFMCSEQTVRRRVDLRLDTYLRGYEKARARESTASALRAEARASKADRLARLAEIPPDTRSLTGRICGDPIPGRSALDRRARA